MVQARLLQLQLFIVPGDQALRSFKGILAMRKGLIFLVFQVIKILQSINSALVLARHAKRLHPAARLSDTQASELPLRILSPANELVSVTRGGCDRCPRRIDVLCSRRRTLTRREMLMK